MGVVLSYFVVFVWMGSEDNIGLLFVEVVDEIV